MPQLDSGQSIQFCAPPTVLEYMDRIRTTPECLCNICQMESLSNRNMAQGTFTNRNGFNACRAEAPKSKLGANWRQDPEVSA